MNNISSETIVSIIAENSKLEKIKSVLGRLGNYLIFNYNSFKEFLLSAETIDSNVILIDFKGINESSIKKFRLFCKEDLDMPFIYLAESKNDPFVLNGGTEEPFEYISDLSDEREVELAISLTLEKHYSEKIIKTGELQFKALLENSSDIFTITDEKGIIRYESPSVKKMLGYFPEELLDRNFFDLVHPEDSENCRKAYSNNIKGTRSEFIIKFRIISKTGQVKIIEALFNNLLYVQGVESVIITGKDITDKRTIEKKLLTNIKRYNALIENLPIGIYRSTPDGKILTANSHLVKMLGYNSFSELEKIDINSSYVQQSIREIFKELVDKFGEAKGFEFEIKRKNSEILFVRDSARAIYDDKGKIIYYEGVLEDITDKKKYESEIISAKETAEKADKLKSYFMAHLSHEIRTPVNSILTFASLLKEEFENKLTGELKESFAIIENSANRLIRTIDLTMNISSLQTGNLDLRFEWLDVERDVLNNILPDYKVKAKYKGLSLSFLNEAKKKQIYADRYSLCQLFGNIIDNAVKYTQEKGEVTIKLYEKEEDLLVDISDSGIGISNEYLTNLFTPFTQEEMGYTRKFEGNGLGLAIAKKYAELNNAVITVQSIKGEGSNFTIKFKEALKIATENFS